METASINSNGTGVYIGINGGSNRISGLESRIRGSQTLNPKPKTLNPKRILLSGSRDHSGRDQPISFDLITAGNVGPHGSSSVWIHGLKLWV